MARDPQYAKALDECGFEILVGDTVEFGSTLESVGIVTAIDPTLGCPFVAVSLDCGNAYYAHTLRVIEEV